MLKRDFIAKYIEELGKMLSKLLDIEYYKDAVSEFDYYFKEMLHSYYHINDEQLQVLLEEDEERDLFLLSFDMKNKNILAFAKAAHYYVEQGETEKARQILAIIERINRVNSDVFRFPTEEDTWVEKAIKELPSLN
ncbi:MULTISPECIES: hypothetical protein [Weeksella]|uniref:Uncharacterized protein n=1 Tax=Weeksella virosa (strain ATCC 43766 / DSM 16922 / JCM 21250 / CCUG 30538 / CDC 9751 / IAM 14551 / NBRC 16016 / NCTC 11634 / CL345/78) TaxID=865938 RepID=F0P2L3_WEEVC|nr:MULTISPECIES: hypothetical protein [Weeksella]ADX67852.1 hypothetical protein Weevi_1143 [Weeksella virosa DSM 16922]MDK7374141.1 hypothetical protein [Weeksella virosa]MDK7674453.1 hypothetical protein [Weeksella virosa]OFM82819.1 hypothetical protein HMPREF2660_03995 [Weeksella sp. HMSC059D05]SUP54155.1 Uncharacterised protein [Weeksella virosa]